MISFYPGPSKLEPKISDYFKEAVELGFLSANHRSEAFMDLLAYVKMVIRKQLDVPVEYEIVFVSSATECWEIVTQSFTRALSLHVYNGAFGEKWHSYANKLTNTFSIPFKLDEEIPIGKINGKADLICITQNETSNGTEVHPAFIQQLYEKLSDGQLLAIDATSSMGGRNLPIKYGDIWFASVQKCFGLPSGLAVMLVSPKAVARAEKLGENKHYNSFKNILKNYRMNQPHHTPNTANIYLLKRVLENRPHISEVDRELFERMIDTYHFFDYSKRLTPLVKYEALRSKTVITIKSDPITVGIIKKQAMLVNLILGNGYGIWKTETFRIANFPAHNVNDFRKLKDFMGAHL
jgi:phosphoserine aminotransferase